MKSLVARIAGLLFGMLVVMFILHPERLLPFWWQTYSDPGGYFSLEFPSKPRATDKQIDSKANGSGVLKMVAATPDKATRYSFIYFEYDGSERPKGTLEEELDSGRDGAISSTQGALLDEQRIQVSGHPARDIQARAGVGSLMNMRIIADGQRLFVLEVDTAAGQKVDSDKVQKFFDSLRFSH